MLAIVRIVRFMYSFKKKKIYCKWHAV